MLEMPLAWFWHMQSPKQFQACFGNSHGPETTCNRQFMQPSHSGKKKLNTVPEGGHGHVYLVSINTAWECHIKSLLCLSLSQKKKKSHWNGE